MIIINKTYLINSEEQLEPFITDLYKFAKGDIETKTIEILEEYFRECYNADTRLTQMVFDLFDENTYPLVILNFGECDNFNEINFSLLTGDKEAKVKKRDELKYHELCDICFGPIVGLQDRIDTYFADYD